MTYAKSLVEVIDLLLRQMNELEGECSFYNIINAGFQQAKKAQNT